MGERVQQLVSLWRGGAESRLLGKKGSSKEKDENAPLNNWALSSWTAWFHLKDCFECCFAWQDVLEEFSGGSWHCLASIAGPSGCSKPHDPERIRPHGMARDDSGESQERGIASAVGHVTVQVDRKVRRALGLLEISIRGLTDRRLSLCAGAASILDGASRSSSEAVCWLWKVLCSGIAECEGDGESLGCSSAFRSSEKALCFCLGLLCLLVVACCKTVKGSRETAFSCWTVLCLCSIACKGAANDTLNPRIFRVLRVVTGAAIGLLLAAVMTLFGCLCLALLVVDSFVYLVSVCLCHGSVALCAHSRATCVVRNALQASDWLLWTVWGLLMSACGRERAFLSEPPNASELKIQWQGYTEGLKWAVKNNWTVRAAAEAVKRALSKKSAACQVIHTVVRQARLGRGQRGDRAVRTADAKGVAIHPGRPVRVRWVIGGKVVTRSVAMKHKAMGRVVFCVPELHGGGGCISAEQPTIDFEQPTADDRLRSPSIVGGHATPSHDNAFLSRTPEQAKEYRVGSTRLGMNDSEVMKALKKDFWGSVHPDAPMRVVRFSSLEASGKLPRSSDNMTVLLSEMPDAKIIFISHRWLRPWHTREECEKNGHEWAGMAHPDDAKGTKHKLICAAVRRHCLEKQWDLDNVCIWLDYCGVEQDNKDLLGKGVASLRGYVTVCDAVIIPSPRYPDAGAETIDLVPGEYGDRGWTRLEAMSFYCISTLRQVETPEIWVAAGDGACFLKRFSYVLRELPSKGGLFSEDDRQHIKNHEEALMKELKTSVVRNGYITKHKGAVKCVVFHPTEEELVASCGEDSKIKLVDRDTGTLRREYLGHEGGVLSIAFNSDGSKLVSGGTDRTVRIWDVAAGKEAMGPLTGHLGWVISVAFSPDGNTLASGSRDGMVRLWEVASGAEKCCLRGHLSEVTSVAFSPDGSALASGSEDKTVRLWDIASGVQMCSLTGNSSWVKSVAFSPDGKMLASGGWDEAVRLWDVASSTEKISLTGSGRVTSVAFSPDGKVIASGSDDQNVKLWNVASGAQMCSLTGHSDEVSSVVFSPNGNTIASGSDDLTVRLWDVASGAEDRSPKGRLKRLSSVIFLFDGDTLASGSHDKSVRQLDVASEAQTSSLKEQSFQVTSVAFSPDGSTLASGNRDETVRLWDVASHAQTCSLMGHSKLVSSVAFSPDGDTLASGSWDHTVRLWDVALGAEKCSLRGHWGLVNSVAFSSDGNTLASGSDDKTVRLWDVALGVQRCSFTGHLSRVSSVTFSPDGNTLASGSRDMTVRIWDVASGAEKCCLEGHSRAVNSVAFSPDGSTLASGSWGENVRIWDVVSGAQKCILRGHSASWVDVGPEIRTLRKAIEQVAWTAQTGGYIVTADQDTVHLYKVPPGRCIDAQKVVVPVASFRCPSYVIAVVCRHPHVCAACSGGQVLFLEAPLLTVRSGD